MAPLRTYLLPAAFAVTAVRATSIEDYVPSCAPKCIYTAVEENSTCEKDDNECICRDIYSLKTHSEDCIEEACTEAEFGEWLPARNSAMMARNHDHVSDKP